MPIAAGVAGRIAEWVAIVATVIGGGAWVGSISTQGDNNEAAITELRPVAVDVAVDIATLKERTENMTKQMDRLEQAQQDILDELRK